MKTYRCAKCYRPIGENKTESGGGTGLCYECHVSVYGHKDVKHVIKKKDKNGNS
jgi:hypothetical protein